MSNIQALRGKRPQREIAQAVGIERSYYSRIECHKADPPVSTAIRVARVLGGNVEALFGNLIDQPEADNA